MHHVIQKKFATYCKTCYIWDYQERVAMLLMAAEIMWTLSVYPDNLVKRREMHTMKVLDNDEMSPIFQATIEQLQRRSGTLYFAAKTTKGFNNYEVPALPVEQIS